MFLSHFWFWKLFKKKLFPFLGRTWIVDGIRSKEVKYRLKIANFPAKSIKTSPAVSLYYTLFKIGKMLVICPEAIFTIFWIFHFFIFFIFSTWTPPTNHFARPRGNPRALLILNAQTTHTSRQRGYINAGTRWLLLKGLFKTRTKTHKSSAPIYYEKIDFCRKKK